VQLARHLGHPVTGVAGAAKQEFLGRLDATWAPTVTDAATVGPVDAVIDLVGGPVLQDAPDSGRRDTGPGPQRGRSRRSAAG
jgi:NADPH:quinone reductase-like Zn-dependent oxidoreductase